MIFKKDNLIFGIILGLFAPVIGFVLFKMTKLSVFGFKETFLYMLYEPGFKTLSVSLSLSLLMNALLFTIYINGRKDNTAKGIFITTLIYGLIVLSLKTFG
jgi:hypothetical protein